MLGRWRRTALAVGAAAALVTTSGAAYGAPAAGPRAAVAAAEPGSAGMLAYTFGVGSRGQTRIATVWTDGSHRQVITKRGNAYGPVWSPDGSTLAYSTLRGVGLMTATGGGQHLVVPGGRSPSWAPDGRRLAFACDEGLCVVDLVTGQRTVVVPTTADWPAVDSSTWSPDGSSLAFTRISADGDDYTSDTQLWTVHADGSGLAAVPGTSPEGIDPLWSPDGTWLMYTEHYGGRGGEYSGDVFLVHPDGTARTPVLTLDGSDAGSSWSPDGSRVVVSSVADLYPTMDGIWTLRPDGTDRQLVVREGWGAQWRPAFTAPLPGTTAARAASGPRLAYVAMTDTGFDLFTARPDGADVRRLTTRGRITSPAWSPDHRMIAFVARNRRGAHALWTIRADGSGAKRRTDVGFQPPQLAWAPGGGVLAYGDGPRLCTYTLASRTRECRRISDNDVDTVSHPSFAPSGRRLVFSLTDNTDVSRLVVTGTHGGPVRRLTQGKGGSALDPSWSPRGDRIAFTLAAGGQFDRRRQTAVLTIRPDGTHPTTLFATPGLDDAPAWSPDGRRVVVRSDGPPAADGTAQPGVWVVDASGRHEWLAVPGRGVAYADW
ncbi:hypothetical protein G5V58_06755 [Nocardioides anomalus]|uniref:Uncharacterized protein n=1 Tax=Nocardioides anomalus TaxID=2712223 RepID=A0A6G6WBA2_9ACTN|nr:PD40 domain-containing protein [Nocardioides anomalus]QIG42512.1 hypothetical protein G5V58_06755 [Nocardioides anomalus]